MSSYPAQPNSICADTDQQQTPDNTPTLPQETASFRDIQEAAQQQPNQKPITQQSLYPIHLHQEALQLTSPTSTITASVLGPLHHDPQSLQATAAIVALNQSLPQVTPTLQPPNFQLRHITESFTPIVQYDPSAAAPPSSGPPHPPTSASPAALTMTAAPSLSGRGTRLRRACDMCSKRKVRCNDDGPPCTPCKDLNLPCTRNREMKRRGPPNRHAEAALRMVKQAKLDSTLRVQGYSPSMVVQTTAVHTADRELTFGLDAEVIAPHKYLSLLVDDFFTYVHPIVPFPHEPSFRQSFLNREDRTSREYLAMLASMIGCLAAFFPRSVENYINSSASCIDRFPGTVSLVDRCRAVAIEARGTHFDGKREMTVYDAATSCLLGLAAEHTSRRKLAGRFFSQSLHIIRELGFDTRRELSATAEHVIDHIKEEVGKRVFWVLYQAMNYPGHFPTDRAYSLFLPGTAGRPCPNLPLEVDDQYILAGRILPQPEGTLSLVRGFNECIKLLLTHSPLANTLVWETLPLRRQWLLVNSCLQQATLILNELPEVLKLQQGTGFGVHSLTEEFEAADMRYYPPAYPALQPPNDIRHVLAAQPKKRRQLQLASQKLNLILTELTVRSLYVEAMFDICDACQLQVVDNDNITSASAEQTLDLSIPFMKENVTLPLLELITQTLVDEIISAEPPMLNQHSMEHQIPLVLARLRQLIPSILAVERPERSLEDPVATRAASFLGEFLELAERLDPNSRLSDRVSEQDVQDGAIAWIQFQQLQTRFASAGGLFGNRPWS